MSNFDVQASIQNSIILYAELLSNIRQVSVAISFASQPDSSTTVEVVDDGSSIQVYHAGETRNLYLPSRTSTKGFVPVAPTSSPNVNIRLPASEVPPRGANHLGDLNALPWSSVDLNPGSPVCCSHCLSPIVKNGVIESWKDLPSENWAEMMEFWHCHKPHEPSRDQDNHDEDVLAQKGYGASNAITSSQSIGLVDLSTIMFSEQDCQGWMPSPPPNGNEAESSSGQLAYPSPGKTAEIQCQVCHAEVGLYQAAHSSITLFKWQISCESKPLQSTPSSAQCLSAILCASISRSGSAKAIVLPSNVTSGPPDSTKGVSALHIWVLNNGVTYTSSQVEGRGLAMKVLYRQIDAGKGLEMLESLTSDLQEVTLPQSAVEEVHSVLRSSGLLLPAKERIFQGWNVALLPRWEAKR